MDILDPRDRDHEHREALCAWLAVQRAFALKPEKLPDVFRTATEPQRHFRDHAIAPLTAEERERVIRVLTRYHVRVLPIASPLYPPRLLRLVDAPPVLTTRGNPALLRARCVAVVGARAATTYGLSVATGLARDLARAGLAVVSGLARGIDAAAHRGALAGGGATVALQACGPETVYPASHRALAGKVIEHGTLVTEFPVGTPPRAPYFPLRNRLISALSEAVIVVEARIRSGSLTTARHAAEQGVDVWAVPGPIDRPTSQGPLLLIREGAGVITQARDLLESLDCAPGLSGSLADAGAAPPEPKDPVERRVWRALRAEPRNPDELARSLSLPAAALGAALAALEVEGRVWQDRDGRFAIASARIVSSHGGERL